MDRRMACNLLDYLRDFDKEVILLGHDNIDCDSAISIILMSNWLTANNIKNRPVICDEVINKETYNILKSAGVDLNQYKGTVSADDYVFLLDHYKTKHSTRVVGCFDHHPTLERMQYIFYCNDEISATSLLVYEAMTTTCYGMSSKEAYLILLAVYLDTCSKLSNKFVPTDNYVIDSLISFSGAGEKELYKIGLCLTDLTVPLSDISTNGRKNYTYSNIGVSSSYIQVDDFNSYEDVLYYIQSNLINSETRLWMFLVSNLNNQTQLEYRVTKDTINCIKHNSVLSRGSDIMPIIEKEILSLIQ